VVPTWCVSHRLAPLYEALEGTGNMLTQLRRRLSRGANRFFAPLIECFACPVPDDWGFVDVDDLMLGVADQDYGSTVTLQRLTWLTTGDRAWLDSIGVEPWS
jgi:hypothetical protein